MRRAPLLPIKAPFAPDMRQRDEQDAHEDEHLDEAEPLELVEGDRPRVEEDRLDVEDDEEHRRQVEAHGQAAVGGGVGDDARLIRGELALGGSRWAEHEAQRDDRSQECEDDQYEDEKWDVALEQVSKRPQVKGLLGTALILIARGRQASPVEPPP